MIPRKLFRPVLIVLTLMTFTSTSPRGCGESVTYFFGNSDPYLGQAPPDSIPVLFAPGIVSTGMYTRDVAMTPDGKEIYFCVSIGNHAFATILCTSQDKGRWLPPEIVPFSAGPEFWDFEPAISPDGSRIYFLSSRPLGDEPGGNQDIWFADRTSDGWGEPRNLGAPVNTDGGEFFPSVTKDGTLYFTRGEKGSGLNHIYRSRFVNGAFQEPERLPEQVNCGTNRFNAFVSPDESFVIVPVVGMEDAFDGVDYYIVFRDQDDRWSEPVNMGPLVNRDNEGGWSPYVSPDGKYFFFMSSRKRELAREEWNYRMLEDLYNHPGNGNADTYWMDAGFFRILKDKARIEQ